MVNDRLHEAFYPAFYPAAEGDPASEADPVFILKGKHATD